MQGIGRLPAQVCIFCSFHSNFKISFRFIPRFSSFSIYVTIYSKFGPGPMLRPGLHPPFTSLITPSSVYAIWSLICHLCPKCYRFAANALKWQRPGAMPSPCLAILFKFKFNLDPFTAYKCRLAVLQSPPFVPSGHLNQSLPQSYQNMAS